MDGLTNFVLGIISGIVAFTLLVLLFALTSSNAAEFVCESHGLDLIDFEVENQTFSKVECGNKKPELQYENYKVFTK